MEERNTKPPKSARAYYVKLYCEKKKSMSPKGSKRSNGYRKALQSWWSLSAAEQQPFVDKFNLILEKYEEKSANYLNLVEPFLKKKATRDEANSDPCVSELESNEEYQLQQLAMENPQDIHEIYNNDSDRSNQVHAASLIDPYENDDPTNPQEINNAADEIDEIQTIPEPTPPSMKNGKELFEMVNSVIGENHKEWKDLSKEEKKKYQSAVLAIKREYIRKYQNYVESLPPKELFQHYITTLEKYWLFSLRPYLVSIPCLIFMATHNNKTVASVSSSVHIIITEVFNHRVHA